jgi:hypothetical protein
MFHESLAATVDMAVHPGVLGCRTLRRTVQVRLGFNFGFRISDFGLRIWDCGFGIADLDLRCGM